MQQLPALDINTLAEMTEPELRRLKKDTREAAAQMSVPEARYLVDLYYTMQAHRVASANQIRALVDSGEPHAVLSLMTIKAELMESEIRACLSKYSDAQPLGRWARSIVGIGPVIAAGLLAHIDFNKAKTAGAIWRFAGLDPTVTWGKGEKRPWNASLKVLCWKMGQSFMKLHNNPDCFYGKLYAERKAFEMARNETGGNADAAAVSLASKKWRAGTGAKEAYDKGRLPDGRIELRAERYAVKLFLSHYFAVGYEMKHGTKAPIPYVIQYGGHVHEIRPPNWPME